MTISFCRLVIHFLAREIDFLHVFKSALGTKLSPVQCLILPRSPKFERHEHHHSAIRSGELKIPGSRPPLSTLFHIAHLPQHKLKMCGFFQEKCLKNLKCYNFLWVQRRHNCSPAASFANCVMTLYLLKVHLQTFLSMPVTQKCQILSCDNLVANERSLYA